MASITLRAAAELQIFGASVSAGGEQHDMVKFEKGIDLGAVKRTPATVTVLAPDSWIAIVRLELVWRDLA